MSHQLKCAGIAAAVLSVYTGTKLRYELQSRAKRHKFVYIQYRTFESYFDKTFYNKYSKIFFFLIM